MKKIYTIILFQLLITNIFCQDFDGCIFIDFEELPGMVTPTDNMILQNQFAAEYGLTFILSDGTSPHLAKTGNPATAFGSAWGNDEPAPGENIGDFFITDNGTLQGLTSPDLIVNFSVPLDSFAASVLDIDFGEVFTIESRDIFGEVIHTITIVDGDPHTGDGLATHFGFNSEECEPPIHSIRFHGTRTTPGAFGLGMDNFSFCTRDPDIRTLISIETIAPTCNSPFGSATLDNQSGHNYTYSLDHGPFQSSPTFNNISPGLHSITFRNNLGCETTVPITIDEFTPLTITDLSETNTSCGEENGSLVVFTTPDANVQYSIDGVNYQTSNIFTDLPPGDYTVTIINQDNCTDSAPFYIQASTRPYIETVIVKDDNCNDSTGSITINAGGGTGILRFSVNDEAPISNQLIPNLPAGDYTVKVTDAIGCVAETQSTILPGIPLVLEELSVQGPDCDAINGTINFQASGGSGLINYWLNDSIYHPVGSFISLPAGIYQLSAIDENGCQANGIANLPIPQCDIFIPNGFTPNGDGINDEFQIFTNTFYDVEVLNFMIFNRWGGLVWSRQNFTINSFHKWWDGTFKNQPAQQDVYTYMINVRHQTGVEEIFAGDVTLVR